MNNFSSLIDMVSKQHVSRSCSFGEVVHTDAQSDANMSADSNFKLQEILLIMEGTEKSESSCYLAIGIDSQVTHHDVAVKKVAEQHILTKCSKCNTFQVIREF